MSNQPSLKPREVVKALTALGYEFYRQKGSHQVFVKEESIIIVPMHKKDMKKGTLNKIVKATGLTMEEFVSYV